MEAELAAERINDQLATGVVLMQGAVIAALYPSKEATAELNKLLTRVQSG